MSLCLYQLLSFSSPQNRKNLKKAHIPRDKDFTGIDYGFLREVIFFRFLFRPKIVLERTKSKEAYEFVP